MNNKKGRKMKKILIYSVVLVMIIGSVCARDYYYDQYGKKHYYNHRGPVGTAVNQTGNIIGDTVQGDFGGTVEETVKTPGRIIKSLF